MNQLDNSIKIVYTICILLAFLTFIIHSLFGPIPYQSDSSNNISKETSILFKANKALMFLFALSLATSILFYNGGNVVLLSIKSILGTILEYSNLLIFLFCFIKLASKMLFFKEANVTVDEGKLVQEIAYSSVFFIFLLSGIGVKTIIPNTSFVFMDDVLLILQIVTRIFLTIFFFTLNFMIILYDFKYFTSKRQKNIKSDKKTNFDDRKYYRYFSKRIVTENTKDLKLTGYLLLLLYSFLDAILLVIMITIKSIKQIYVFLSLLLKRMLLAGKDVLNVKLQYFPYYSARVSLILSICITFLIIKYNSIVSDVGTEMYEFFASVILIPIIIAQIVRLRSNKA